jgi:hypothetical protein
MISARYRSRLTRFVGLDHTIAANQMIEHAGKMIARTPRGGETK